MWANPKTDWTPADGVSDEDFKRIESNIKFLRDVQEAHTNDYAYQTPIIVGTQIQLEKQSDTSRLYFKLLEDLSGGAITISLDEGVTDKPLVDVDGVAVTELSKGFVEVVEDVANFTYAPRGASLKYFDNISINKNTSSVGSIKSMSVDNDYIYATTSLSKLCKISKSTLDMVNNVDIGTQYATDVNVDNDYIYFLFDDGASTLSKIMKYRKSDLTKVAESTSYATGFGNLKSDNSYLYFSKNDGSYWSLYKMNKSNLSIASQVTNIFQYKFYLTLDSSFVYVSGGTTLKKYNISNLTLVAYSQSTLQGVLYNDSLNIYMRGTSGDKHLTKYVKSTLVIELQSKTALNHYSMGLDDDNIYIGLSPSTSGILIIKKSDFSTIGTSEIQGITRCIDTDSLFVYASRGDNMLIKYDKPVVPYYSYKTLKLVPMNN